MINNNFNPYDELETHARILREHNNNIEMILEENVNLNLMLLNVTKKNVELSELIVQITKIINELYEGKK